MWNGFWCYRYLLWNLVSRDFKLKYRRSVLGVVWSVLNPLLMCLVYWAVFSSLMDMRGSGIDNFAVFLMCGQLLFNFFNEATSTGMSSVLGAAPLLKKVYIPKYIFPLEKCCFAMVNCIFSFVALLLVMVWTLLSQKANAVPPPTRARCRRTRPWCSTTASTSSSGRTSCAGPMAGLRRNSRTWSSTPILSDRALLCKESPSAVR